MQKRRLLSLVLGLVMLMGTGIMNTDMKVNAKELKIEQEVPALKDSLALEFGEEFHTGASICLSDMNDENVMALVMKHFNAITFGNELKPDCIFLYSNERCPGKTKAVLNGKEIEVPVTSFDRAEKMLEYVYKWNEENPDNAVKIRGHVLTWHSQTPEWFFHEDYDAAKPYVSKEVMTLRHEWYIKTVLEHFTGSDSKYKDMFYGWDVVNEAVSDGTGTYRNDSENSSWWAVYQSNEFIINAFKFANKYAPATVELYYNDYNECDSKKSDGIAQLLSDVKAADGTRIDGFGMQGHYRNEESNPSVDDFKKVAKKYADIVGKVQLTELDFQCSSTYDGTKDTYNSEDFKLGQRYLSFYKAMKELRAEGTMIDGMTVWGVIDKNSWLQNRSSVGGGANGSKKQMPLLFNDDYKVKQAYWAFVDTTKLSYPIEELSIIQSIDYENEEANKKNSLKYTFTDEETNVTFVPTWIDGKIKVYVDVEDDSRNSTDEISLYYTLNDEIQKQTIAREACTENKKGYSTVFEIEGDTSTICAAGIFRMDLVARNNDTYLAFSDKALNQELKSDNYAIATLKTLTLIPKATVEVDGQMEDIWYSTSAVSLSVNMDSKATATARLLWDEENLYVFFDVKDDTLNSKTSEAEQQDSVEIFIDEKNQKAGAYQSDDKQYRISYLNTLGFNGQNAKEENIKSEVVLTEDGYIVEASIKWTNIQAYHKMKIGLNLQVNDSDKAGNRTGLLNWSDASDESYMNTAVFGTAILGDEGEIKIPEATEALEEQTEAVGWFRNIIIKLRSFFKK